MTTQTPPSPWTPDAQARWQRIVAHPIGGTDGQTELERRLAQKHGWSPTQIRLALQEYRRFVFLAGVSGHEVTPSADVDAVWHEHLLFTRDYWGAFCTQVLGAALHHEPGTRDEDVPRHRRQYAQTLASYARWFGPAPEQLWPAARALTSAAQATRGAHAVRASWTRARLLRIASAVGIGLVPALVWAAQPRNPLDWNGPDFLGLYLGLIPVALLLGLVLRAWLRRQLESPSRDLGALDPLHVAYLSGGPMRAFETGVADLHQQGALHWDTTLTRFTRGTQRKVPAPLDAIADLALQGGVTPSNARALVEVLQPVRQHLERRGLWFEAARARRIALISALPATALLAFGAIKIGLGVARDRPVLLLVLLTALVAAMALGFFVARPGRSAAGQRELGRLQKRHAPPGRRTPDTAGLPLAVALGGTAVLAGTGLAGWHQARAATSSDVWSSTSSDSGGDSGSGGGGSSCGGCGGGGD